MASRLANKKIQYVLEEVAGLHTKFDKLFELMSRQNSSEPYEKNENELLVENIEKMLPVKSEEGLKMLNIRLSEKEFQRVLINHMSSIGGTAGNKHGLKIGYKLLDKLLDRNFLIKCSWTGSTKDKTLKKVAFLKFGAVIDTIYKILHLADARFSMSDNEEFLRKILKNSVSRSKQIKISKNIAEPPSQQPDLEPGLQPDQQEVKIKKTAL